MAELNCDRNWSELFENCPLLSHAEVVERGDAALVQDGVTSGRVGSRTLTPGNQGSTVYWIKRRSEDTHDRGLPSSIGVSDTPGNCGRTSPKLKRTLPTFVSPLVCHDDAYTGPKRPRLTPLSSAESRVEVEELVRERTSLERKLKEKKSQLSKLKLVKLYRSKNDLSQLDQLILRWRQASQEAADMLLAKSCRDPTPTMTQLLDHLHIDHSLIRYSTEQESFY